MEHCEHSGGFFDDAVPIQHSLPGNIPTSPPVHSLPTHRASRIELRAQHAAAAYRSSRHRIACSETTVTRSNLL
jgi:hypothetical protein